MAQTAVRADFPKPSGPINDFANVLDDATERELLALVTAVEVQTTAEIAVATVPSLNGLSVEEYGNKLFAEWGIGQKGKDNGVLVLVAPSERKIRIEVGYGLEPILPDGLAGAIIRDQFIPSFRKSDFQSGVLDGVRRIAATIRVGQVLSDSQLQALQAPPAPPAIVLPGWVVLAFLVLPVAGGGYVIGIATRAKVISILVIGLIIAGGGLTFSYWYSVWGLMLQLLVVALAIWGGTKKAESKAFRKSLRGQTSRHGWVGDMHSSSSSSSSGSSSSSSSSSSSFGGGSSGGGGASGSW